MFARRRINVFLLVFAFVFVGIIFNLKSYANADELSTSWPERNSWEDDHQFLDYGSTTTWMPGVRTTANTEKIFTEPITSPTTSKQNATLSPQEALEFAKIMVLPLNDSTRQQALLRYGANKDNMEHMMERWMKENINDMYPPLDNGTTIKVIRNDTWKTPTTEPTPTQKGMIDLMKLNLPGASFWEVGNPAAQPLIPNHATTLMYNVNTRAVDEEKIQAPSSSIPKIEEKLVLNKIELPGASFWEEGNPAAQPLLPGYATTLMYNIPHRAIKEGDTTPGDSVNKLLGLTDATLADPYASVAASTAAAATGVAALLNEVSEEKEDEYEYSSPSWDDMPTLSFLGTTASSLASTTTSPSPLSTQSSQHRVVVRAKQLMAAHYLNYLSGFISALAEIISVHKEGRRSKELALGAGLVIDRLTNLDRFEFYIGRKTLDYIRTIANGLTAASPQQIRTVMDTVHVVFQNHSYFRPEVREVIAEIENWFTIKEGEELLETLVSVETYPKQNKKASIIMQGVLDVVLKPFYRLAGTEKRANTLQKLERVLSLQQRRQFDINSKEKVTTNTKDTSTTIHQRIEKQLDQKTRYRSVITSNETDYSSNNDHVSKETDKTNKERDEIKYDLKFDIKNSLYKITTKTDKYRNKGVLTNYYPKTTKVNDGYNRYIKDTDNDASKRNYNNYQIEKTSKKKKSNRNKNKNIKIKTTLTIMQEIEETLDSTLQKKYKKGQNNITDKRKKIKHENKNRNEDRSKIKYMNHQYEHNTKDKRKKFKTFIKGEKTVKFFEKNKPAHNQEYAITGKVMDQDYNLAKKKGEDKNLQNQDYLIIDKVLNEDFDIMIENESNEKNIRKQVYLLNDKVVKQNASTNDNKRNNKNIKKHEHLRLDHLKNQNYYANENEEKDTHVQVQEHSLIDEVMNQDPKGEGDIVKKQEYSIMDIAMVDDQDTADDDNVRKQNYSVTDIIINQDRDTTHNDINSPENKKSHRNSQNIQNPNKHRKIKHKIQPEYQKISKGTQHIKHDGLSIEMSKEENLNDKNMYQEHTEKHQEISRSIMPITKKNRVPEEYDSILDKEQTLTTVKLIRKHPRHSKRNREEYGTKLTRITKIYYLQKRYSIMPRQNLRSKNKRNNKDKKPNYISSIENLELKKSEEENSVKLRQYLRTKKKHVSRRPKIPVQKSKYVNAALKSKENIDVSKKDRKRFKDTFKAKRKKAKNNHETRRVLDESSYSDAESIIKFKLYDELRNDDMDVFGNRRRSFGMRDKKWDLTSQSDKEEHKTHHKRRRRHKHTRHRKKIRYEFKPNHFRHSKTKNREKELSLEYAKQKNFVNRQKYEKTLHSNSPNSNKKVKESDQSEVSGKRKISSFRPSKYNHRQSETNNNEYYTQLTRMTKYHRPKANKKKHRHRKWDKHTSRKLKRDDETSEYVNTARYSKKYLDEHETFKNNFEDKQQMATKKGKLRRVLEESSYDEDVESVMKLLRHDKSIFTNGRNIEMKRKLYGI